MTLNALVDSFLPQSEKCGTERVNCLVAFCHAWCGTAKSRHQSPTHHPSRSNVLIILVCTFLGPV